MLIWNILSSSAGLMYIVPLIGFALTHQFYHIEGLIGLFGTLCIGEFLKHIVIGTNGPRPQGARDCNLWCNDGPQGGRPGMPSTHSAQVAFFAIFYSYHLKKPWMRAALYAYALLVMLSRYIKQCHSFPQIVAGTALGIGLCVMYRA